MALSAVHHQSNRLQPAGEPAGTQSSTHFPPLNFFYCHLHDCIRAELELLSVLVENLVEDAPLEELQERFKFLGQLNQYHSSVEDEVVYPALDSKVKNVTLAYSVEHQDEEMLFEQLAQLTHTASTQTGLERTETIRGLICKVEEIHRTLKKHLAKEEEQLLPLLLQHFSFSEQADLVAQFLYCIPLATVERVLAWLKPTVPKVELEQLLGHMRSVVPDQLLLQLLSDWLKPDSPEVTDGGAGSGRVPRPGMPSSSFHQQHHQQHQRHAAALPLTPAAAKQAEAERSNSNQKSKAHSRSNGTLAAANAAAAAAKEMGSVEVCCGQPQQCAGIQLVRRAPSEKAEAPMANGDTNSTWLPNGAANHAHGSTPTPAAPAAAAAAGAPVSAEAAQNMAAEPRPPIKEIIHIHRTICTALEDFAHEAGLLRQMVGVTPQQLALLVERHRFLRSVCMFHSLSEDEIMYPEVRRLAAADPNLVSTSIHCMLSVSTCEQEHETEVSALEDLGRLLADVRAFVRRGRKEVDTMLQQLHQTAQQVCSDIAAHMAREETEVFPLLARHLCATQQRVMVWRTLRAMPLRLLERVMPRVTAKLSEKGTEELLDNIRKGAPASDLPLVQLVTRWASKGQQAAQRSVQHTSVLGPHTLSTSIFTSSPSPSCQPSRTSSSVQLSQLGQQLPQQPRGQPTQQPLSRTPSSQPLHQLQHNSQLQHNQLQHSHLIHQAHTQQGTHAPHTQQLPQQQCQDHTSAVHVSPHQFQQVPHHLPHQQQPQQQPQCCARSSAALQQLQQQYHEYHEQQRMQAGLLPLAPQQPLLLHTHATGANPTHTPPLLRPRQQLPSVYCAHVNAAPAHSSIAQQQQQQQQQQSVFPGAAAANGATLQGCISSGANQGATPTVNGGLHGFPPATAAGAAGIPMASQPHTGSGHDGSAACHTHSQSASKRQKRGSDLSGSGVSVGAAGSALHSHTQHPHTQHTHLRPQQQQLDGRHAFPLQAAGAHGTAAVGIAEVNPAEGNASAVVGSDGVVGCARKRGRDGEGLVALEDAGEAGSCGGGAPCVGVGARAGQLELVGGVQVPQGSTLEQPQLHSDAQCTLHHLQQHALQQQQLQHPHMLQQQQQHVHSESCVHAVHECGEGAASHAGLANGLVSGVESEPHSTHSLGGAPPTALTSQTPATADAHAADAHAATAAGAPTAAAAGKEGSGQPSTGKVDVSRGSQFNPIDHIFQFHQALRQELKQLESDALCLEQNVLSHLRHVEQEQQHTQQRQPQNTEESGTQQQQQQCSTHDGSGGSANAAELSSMGSGMCGYINRLPRRIAAAMQALDGRFQFLWGIYKAHSRSEDEIVFPALESKQALRNVSHAYTLDHQEEEKQFLDLEQVMAALRSVPDVEKACSYALAARRMCAAVRASLETHIRAEESELWPLFTEHFTVEEQQYLVGVIIGRTGAQVLQALLPWISGSFSLEDKEMMMGSLRQATKNTMFDQWLEAVTNTNSSGDATPNGSGANGSGGHALEHPTPSKKGQSSHQAQQASDTLDPELARYLSISPAPGKERSGRTSAGPSSSGGVKGRDGPAEELPVESSTFRPGWEDIFRMNQKQLEAAVMRVSADPNLEPGRKAYLIQNIMVSKYIVAQQKRMQQEKQEEEEGRVSEEDADDIAAAGADPGKYQGRVARRTYHDAAQGILGCKHYKRRTQLVAPCCGQIFTCRLCHDEAMPSHRMDRSAVSEMVCMECGTRQPVGSHCAHCSTCMARYYCNICHLFDDQEGRDIYHCPFCNVCRRGRGLGIDFFHCMSCNACMSLSLFKVHNCREKAMESNCPVCSDYLFDSADSIKELPCGHFMHTRCFAEYTRYNYTCPICSKSVGDMHVYFQMLDSLLASERLPPEYAGRMQHVLCNDCGKTGFTRFHWAYHSCPHCRSYNTRLL